MTLATHTVVGSTLGRLTSRVPVVGFLLGFASHFLLDAIPHWDYRLSSSVKDEVNPLNSDIVLGHHFVWDLLKIGFDVLLGVGVTFLLYGGGGGWHNWSLWTGAFGAILPDFLQFVYYKFRRWPLSALQRFHLWIHTEKRLDGRPVLGVTLQVLLTGVVFLLLGLPF